MVGPILQQTYSRVLCLYNPLHSLLTCPGMQTLADESRIISVYRFSLTLIFIRITMNSAWNLAFFEEIWNINPSLLKCISFSSSRREPLSLHFYFFCTIQQGLFFHFTLPSKVYCLMILELCLLMVQAGFPSRSILCFSLKYFSSSLLGLFFFVATYSRSCDVAFCIWQSEKWQPLGSKGRQGLPVLWLGKVSDF